jgi:hypothetical protein
MWKTPDKSKAECLAEREALVLKPGIDCGQRCERLWIPKIVCSTCPLLKFHTLRDAA